MPAAVFSVGPIPCPSSRYQSPPAAFTSTPAPFQSLSSIRWVPLSSPRLANGALLCRNPRQRRRRVLATLHARRIALWAHDHEVVVHHVAPVDAESLGHELVLASPVMDEQRVRIPLAAHLQGLPGPDRHHPDLDPARLLELRQKVAEQPRLLGRGRGRQRDELLLR